MDPTQVRSSYRRSLRNAGELSIVRRYSGTGTSRPKIDVNAYAKEEQYVANDLVGDIRQGESKLVLSSEDLEDSALALPIPGDKLVFRGRELVIATVAQRRAHGVLVAYEVTVKG